MLTPVQFEQLKHSIREYGQQTPIIVTPNMEILDGRNRYKACIAIGMHPSQIKATVYDGPLDASTLFLIENIHRRQLSPSQLACVAVNFTSPQVGQKTPTIKQIAKTFRVNPVYVSLASRIRRSRPDIFKAVFDGEIEIKKAKRLCDVSCPNVSNASGVLIRIMADGAIGIGVRYARRSWHRTIRGYSPDRLKEAVWAAVDRFMEEEYRREGTAT
jgi:hypothetical protein